MKLNESTLRKIIREEYIRTSDVLDKSPKLSEGLRWHLEESVSFESAVYRTGTAKYFELIKEARKLYESGAYESHSDFESDLLESDLGEWAVYEGKPVPLDFPIQEGTLVEAQYKGRDVELGKPKRGAGGKSYVYVKDSKTGNVKKISFGSSMADAMGDSDAARKRRKSFGARHKCAQKKDRTKPGYWACRSTKFFGRNIPGWW